MCTRVSAATASVPRANVTARVGQTFVKLREDIVSKEEERVPTAGPFLAQVLYDERSCDGVT